MVIYVTHEDIAGPILQVVHNVDLALYHNLNILISRCKGAKLFLGAQYGFH